MLETDLHDLSDDADYAASQQQVRRNLLFFLGLISRFNFLSYILLIILHR